MSLMHRCAKSPAFWFGALLLGGGVATNLGAGDTSIQAPAAQEDQVSAEEKIMREGTRIETQSAEVRQEADQLAVHLSGHSIPLIALETLAMQRVLLALIDDPADKKWTVTGTVTEFQGRNYILLERVTRATK